MFSKIKSFVYHNVRISGSYIIPKKKKFFLFYPTQNRALFAGNIKALFLYIKQQHPKIKTRLIAENPQLIKEAKKFGLKTVQGNIKALWAYWRAEHIILDCYAKSEPLSRANFSLIQLWHGVGFKKTALLDENHSVKRRKWYSEIFKKYNLFSTTAESDLKRQNEAFGISTAKITGYPRNDDLFRADFNQYVERLKEKYRVQNYSGIISYLPTFRDFETTPPFTERFWSELQNYLEKENKLFLCKKHPKDKFLQVPNNLPNIKDFSRLILDVQDLNFITDVLITDYSSMCTDFALTNKPILMYAYDYEDYQKNCRELYYDLEEILPKPFIYNEEQLLKALKQKLWLNSPNYKKSYVAFKNKFHFYKDGNSSQRVLEEIFKISN